MMYPYPTSSNVCLLWSYHTYRDHKGAQDHIPCHIKTIPTRGTLQNHSSMLHERQLQYEPHIENHTPTYTKTIAMWKYTFFFDGPYNMSLFNSLSSGRCIINILQRMILASILCTVSMKLHSLVTSGDMPLPELV